MDIVIHSWCCKYLRNKITFKDWNLLFLALRSIRMKYNVMNKQLVFIIELYKKCINCYNRVDESSWGLFSNWLHGVKLVL